MRISVISACGIRNEIRQEDFREKVCTGSAIITTE